MPLNRYLKYCLGMPRPGLLDITLITSFAEADEVLKSRNFMQDQLLEPSKAPALQGNLNSLQGAPHFRRRRVESALFRRPSLIHYEDDILIPELRQALRRLAENAGSARPVRTHDLPLLLRSALVRASAALLGLDLADDAAVDRLVGYSTTIAEGRDVIWATKDQTEVINRVHAAWKQLLSDLYLPSRRRRERLIEEKAPLPVDLITVLLLRPESLSGPDGVDLIAHEVGLFLTASVNTTTVATPRTVEFLCRWLEDHAEDRARLDDESFLRSAAQEALRLHPTVPYLLRQAVAEIRLSSGREVARNELVRIDISATNQDVSVFGADAAEYNPHRRTDISRSYGLSFGGGIHMCIGLELTTGVQSASAEERTAGMVIRILRELFATGLELDPENPVRLESGTTQRKYVAFPALFTKL
jgi:cytochrome P450